MQARLLPHGGMVLGAIKDIFLAQDEVRLAPGVVLLTEPASAGPLTVADGRVHSGRLLLHFKGVNDRNGAEALRGTMLIAEIDPEDRPEDPEEDYDHQLIGLAVVLADGTPVGELAEIAHLPSQELLTVKRPDGSEVLVPFVTEIVPEIDMERRRIVLTPPPGLINTDEAEVASARDGEVQDAGLQDAATSSDAEVSE